MKCAKSKKLVYLYNELDPDERSVLDRHLATCETCQALLEEVQAYKEKVRRHRSVPTSADEPLTDRIMRAVTATRGEPRPSHRNFPATFSNHYVPRAAFAALSIILVAAFIAELSHPAFKTSSSTQEYAGADIKSVELNSQAFHDRADSLFERSLATSLFACLSICKNNEEPAACEVCQSRLKKLRTIYARI